jgi:hypothetical protein
MVTCDVAWLCVLCRVLFLRLSGCVSFPVLCCAALLQGEPQCGAVWCRCLFASVSRMCAVVLKGFLCSFCFHPLSSGDACPAGSFSSSGTGCSPCVWPLASAVGAARCSACPVGSVPLPSLSGCTTCSIGQFANGSRCELCPPGFYQSLPGATSCTPCPRDTFNPSAGASSAANCVPCVTIDSRMVTVETGAATNASCVCGAGFFLDPVRSTCLGCGQGLQCNSSGVDLASLPVVPGFWRASPNSTVVLKCRLPRACAKAKDASADGGVSRRRVLLEDDPNCAPHHTGPLCEVCQPGFVMERGVCVDCTSGGFSVLLTAAGIVVVVLLGVLIVLRILSAVCCRRQQRSRTPLARSPTSPSPNASSGSMTRSTSFREMITNRVSHFVGRAKAALSYFQLLSVVVKNYGTLSREPCCGVAGVPLRTAAPFCRLP